MKRFSGLGFADRFGSLRLERLRGLGLLKRLGSLSLMEDLGGLRLLDCLRRFGFASPRGLGLVE